MPFCVGALHFMTSFTQRSHLCREWLVIFHSQPTSHTLMRSEQCFALPPQQSSIFVECDISSSSTALWIMCMHSHTHSLPHLSSYDHTPHTYIEHNGLSAFAFYFILSLYPIHSQRSMRGFGFQFNCSYLLSSANRNGSIAIAICFIVKTNHLSLPFLVRASQRSQRWNNF